MVYFCVACNVNMSNALCVLCSSTVKTSEFWVNVWNGQWYIRLSTGSHRSSLSEFQATGLATANARRPYVLRLCRVTTRRRRLAERRHRLVATSETGSTEELCHGDGCVPWTRGCTSLVPALSTLWQIKSELEHNGGGMLGRRLRETDIS